MKNMKRIDSHLQGFTTNGLEVWQRNESIVGELLILFMCIFQLFSEFILNMRMKRKEI